MSFLDNLKEEASFTETLNGAKLTLPPAMPVWICLLSLAVCVIVHTVTRFTSLIVLISKIQSWQ